MMELPDHLGNLSLPMDPIRFFKKTAKEASVKAWNELSQEHIEQ